MPYIKSDRRKEFVNYSSMVPMNAGELNFKITDLLIDYLWDNYNYQKINDVMGALEGAKLEMYRRLAAPYEDKAIERNGDLY